MSQRPRFTRAEHADSDAPSADAVFLLPPMTVNSRGLGTSVQELDPRMLVEVHDIIGLNVSQIAIRSSNELIDSRASQAIAFVLSYVHGRALIDQGLNPLALAGHSLGQYAALALSQALEFSVALQLVKARGEAIQAIQPPDDTELVKVHGLPASEVEELCAPADLSAWPATIAADDEVILRGTKQALAELAPRLRAKGADRVVLLMGSGLLHTPLMSDAVDAMRSALATVPFSTPQIPVASSTSGSLEPDPERWRDLLARELDSPVRWHECLRAVPGDVPLIEVGVAGELAELARKAFPDRATHGVSSRRGVTRVLDAFGIAPVPA